MPKKGIDYSNTVIYRIVCKDTTITDCYIGHTTSFIKRKNQHKSACNSEKYNLNIHQFIRNNGGWDNWSMIEIEKKNCTNRNEAEKHERYYIEYYNSTLNQVMPTRTIQEWRKDNKELLIQKQKQYVEANKEAVVEGKHNWYQDNKNVLNQKHKEYYEENKAIISKKCIEYYENKKEIILENGKEYYKSNKESIKEKVKMYSEKHKEYIEKYKKQYYQDNKQNILEKEKEKVECICGCQIRRGGLLEHQRTKKHIDAMKNKEEPDE
jgi:hypothetical protein